MTDYVGRFAPSPTGPLHLGSLVTALASWVDARQHAGRWLVRIEDIDPPREVPGASHDIITSLEAHGLYWDGEIMYQRTRSACYERALEKLRVKKRLFACQCTRRQLRAEAKRTDQSAYPGHCRRLNLEEGSRPLRFLVEDVLISFSDLHTGEHSENVSRSVGDFIVRRKDSLYAYQLAVVVDDAAQGITHVVRGADLLDNSARQIALQQALGLERPAYLHLPLLLSADGKKKLSKQTGATALDNNLAIDNLQSAWNFLGQTPISDAKQVNQFLKIAVNLWNRYKIPAVDSPLYQF